MNEINKNEKPVNELSNNFDTLSQGFDNGNFYGLEYILEDFFQRATLKPAIPAQQPVDWFGLYS